MSNKCQKCGIEEIDLRTLWMACSYDMNELELPFNEIKIPHAEYGHRYTKN